MNPCGAYFKVPRKKGGSRWVEGFRVPLKTCSLHCFVFIANVMGFRITMEILLRGSLRAFPDRFGRGVETHLGLCHHVSRAPGLKKEERWRGSRIFSPLPGSCTVTSCFPFLPPCLFHPSRLHLLPVNHSKPTPSYLLLAETL